MITEKMDRIKKIKGQNVQKLGRDLIDYLEGAFVQAQTKKNTFSGIIRIVINSLDEAIEVAQEIAQDNKKLYQRCLELETEKNSAERISETAQRKLLSLEQELEKYKAYKTKH